MSRLFIELYLDEDVDILVADLVRARGFGVLTTRYEILRRLLLILNQITADEMRDQLRYI